MQQETQVVDFISPHHNRCYVFLTGGEKQFAAGESAASTTVSSCYHISLLELAALKIPSVCSVCVAARCAFSPLCPSQTEDDTPSTAICEHVAVSSMLSAKQ